MIAYVSGTYHGLFVETASPSVLPKDISFFDFRTKDGRCIPKDGNPNLILRFNGEMLMVALLYRATEGNRQGFMSFGCLFISDFNHQTIYKGMMKAIELAKSASSYFNGSVILERPPSIDGRKLDLTELPLVEPLNLFGHLKLNINQAENLIQIARITEDFVSQDWGSFEVIVNAAVGVSAEELKQSLDEQAEKAWMQELLAERAKKRAAEKQLLDQKLQKQKLVEEQKRRQFFFAYAAYAIALVSVAALVFFGMYTFFLTEPIENKEAGKTVSPEIVNNSYTDDNADEIVSKTSIETRSQETDLDTNCYFDDLSTLDGTKAKIVTDLRITSKCISIAEDFFDGESLPKIMVSKNPKINLAAELPKKGDLHLTKFSSLLSGKSSGNFLTEIPDAMSIAVSFTVPEPILVCTPSQFSEMAPDFQLPEFAYYSSSEGEYDDLMRGLSRGVAHHIMVLYQQLADELLKIEGANEELTDDTIKLRRLSNEIKKPDGSFSVSKKLDPQNWKNAADLCVILVEQADQRHFIDTLVDQNFEYSQFSFKQYFAAHKFIPTDYIGYADNMLSSTCRPIPDLLAIHNDDLGQAALIEEIRGLSPYSVDGEQFDFFPKTSYKVGEIMLPDIKSGNAKRSTDIFSALQNRFDSPSPISSDRFRLSDFCRIARD